MKRYIQIISVLLPVFVLAQKQISVDNYFFKGIYDKYVQSPIFMTEADFQNFTVSSLYFNNNQGYLHLGQESTHSTDFGVKPHGYYKGEKITFFGNLDIQRNYQYDKKWTLAYADVQPNGIMPDPHYMAVSKESDWNNQKYDILGGIIVPLSRIWDFSLSVDYNLSEKYRTEYDPRPQIIANHLKFSGQTALKINDKHKIAIGGSYGNMGVDNSISYSDEDSNTPVYYKKYLRWMFGYGTLQSPLYSSAKRKRIAQEGNVGYHYKGDKQSLLAYFSYQNSRMETFQNNADSAEEEESLAKYNLTTYTTKLHYIKDLVSNKKIQIYAEASDISGDNHLRLQDGKNYASSQQNASLGVQLYNTAKKEGFGMEVAYQSAYQKNAISQTITDHSNVESVLFASKEYHFPKIGIATYAKLLFSYPLSNKLTNENLDYYKTPSANTDYALRALQLFYNEVVYPDYDFFEKNQYGLDFGVDFKKNISEQSKMVFGISSKYKTTFKSQDRYFLSTHITLYY